MVRQARGAEGFWWLGALDVRPLGVSQPSRAASLESLANPGRHSGVLLERRPGADGSDEQIFGAK